MPLFPASTGPNASAKARAWLRAHRGAVGIAVAMVLGAVYPWAVGTVAAHVVASKLTTRLGRTVTVGRGRAGFGDVALEDVRVAGTTGPELAVIGRVVAPFGVALGGRGPVRLAGVHASVVRGGPDDNVTSILERLKARGGGGGGGGGGPPGIVIESATIEARDHGSGLAVAIDALDGELIPDGRLALHARGVHGVLALAGEDQGPRFGADEIHIEGPLEGRRPKGLPSIRVKGGFATPLPTLSLTGISGVVAPPPADASAPAASARAVTIDLHGSYGGAREDLWTAKGHADFDKVEGALALRAEQFSLDKIADVLPKSVLSPERTTLDAAFDLSWSAGAVRFGGDLSAVGVSLQNDALASDPVEDVSMTLALRGNVVPATRRIELERLEARVRDLTARLTGSVELPPGSYRFGNGRRLPFVPKIDLTFSVPRLPCAKLLASVPSALTPKLEGFALQGLFEAQVGAKIDFADLDALDLHGKVGIDGCKVLRAPDTVTKLGGEESIVVDVEVPPPPGPGHVAGETETMSVVIGPDNPDFAPYAEISPYLVNSIMTTEDNGFFKHRGWVPSEFKSAFKRDLAHGGFRLGASSITMQMVKNVLLSQEKTLSRKLQELFLVWYLEQNLPKERILELYFNAIEFGPRIYGIGAASRHYFGKKPSELNPVEAAFFSSILPSPKRRYVQYCHGALTTQWDKYVHRIVAKVHERGRLTDEELAQWSVTPLVFDRAEATFTEKQCQDWVKSMVPVRLDTDAPPELEDADDEGGDSFSARKNLRRLFAHGGRPRATALAPRAPALAPRARWIRRVEADRRGGEDLARVLRLALGLALRDRARDGRGRRRAAHLLVVGAAHVVVCEHVSLDLGAVLHLEDVLAGLGLVERALPAAERARERDLLRAGRRRGRLRGRGRRRGLARSRGRGGERQSQGDGPRQRLCVPLQLSHAAMILQKPGRGRRAFRVSSWKRHPRPARQAMPDELLSTDPATVCAALSPLLLDERRARIDAVVAARLGGLRVVIENLHDPHNGAAVLRSAEAFGIQRVEVIESLEPFRFSSTVTQGCEKWLDVVRHKTLDAAVGALRRDGFVIYAAVPGADASVEDLNFSRPAAVMVGNEHDGLTGAAIDAADRVFGVPMPGMTASLNLSVATALIAERAAALRRRALRAEGDLDPAEQLALRARFYATSVRGAEAIVARYVARYRAGAAPR